MGTLIKIPFEEESTEIKQRVQKYWSKRADSFFRQRCNELESDKANRWKDEINKLIPQGKTLKVLDVGCGAGFFEVLLGRQGHQVVGIDLTSEMIELGNLMIKKHKLTTDNAKCMVMDAEAPEFEDETFDLIITRNLTWTLPHPLDAYKEWHRLLRRNGMLLVFDAEYAKSAHKLGQPEHKAHRMLTDEMRDEAHEIYHMLTMSTLSRPNWDVEVLSNIGFTQISTDIEFGDRVYKEMDEFYSPDHMFRISAMKE